MKTSIWDILSILALLGVVLLVILFASIFITPYSALMVAPTEPTSTITPFTFPSTWTPTLSSLLSVTPGGLRLTATPFQTSTLFSLSSFTPSPTRTETPTLTATPTITRTTTNTPTSTRYPTYTLQPTYTRFPTATATVTVTPPTPYP